MNLFLKFKDFINENNISTSSDEIYYYGSNTKFSSFENVNNKTYKEFDIASWFFTKDINYAKSYGEYLYTVKLHVKKTFDTRKKEYFNLLISYLKDNGFDDNSIDNEMDEKYHHDLPYWTFDDAYYAATANKCDSIFLHEELDREVISIAVFDKDLIEILSIVKDD
jgi:hypothetical protein